MTLEAMQRHESVTLQYGPSDYRRVGLIELLRPRVCGERILDMRSLNGELVLAWAKAGKEVVGLDGYHHAVERANKRIEAGGLDCAQVFEWDLEHLPEAVSGTQFDAILCGDLLNHVKDDGDTLDQIAGLLGPGGTLTLVVPAFPALIGPRDQSLGHLRRYTRRSIRTLLEQHGFCVGSIRYWNFCALLPYLMVEKWAGRELTDRMRYQAAEASSKISGPLLRWWYRHIERLISFPTGLSLIVDATLHPSP